MALTLYSAPGSCSMIPRILLTHLAIPYKLVTLKLGPDGYESPEIPRAEFLKVNPKGYIPALRDSEGQTITEMPSILTYIVLQRPKQAEALLGATPLEKSRVLEWSCFLSGTLHGAGFGAFWRSTRFVESDAAEEVHSLVKEGGRKRILDCYDKIEQGLPKGSQFAVGGRTTVVDIQLHTFWRWGKLIGIDMSPYQQWEKVMNQVEKIPALREVMEKEGQSQWLLSP